MGMYDDISRVASEVGWTPDAVLTFASWGMFLLGGAIFFTLGFLIGRR